MGEDGILDQMVAIIQVQVMAMAAGIQDLILATTPVPILEIIMEDGILNQMVAIIQVQVMAMAAGIQDLILEIIMEDGTLDQMVAIILVQTMTMDDGILIRIPAMGVDTTLEMAGIQGQIMEDGTLDGEAECCVGKS